jgi:predicted nucleic acid-binding protein
MAPPLNFFIDTNVLAYAYDRSEVENYLRAWTVLPITPMIVNPFLPEVELPL